MTFEAAKEFEAKLKSKDVSFEKIPVTDDSLGYAIGRLHSEYRKRVLYNPNVGFTNGLFKISTIKKRLMSEMKLANSKISFDDDYMRKLLGYVTAGLMEKNDDNVSDEMRNAIIVGMNINLE